MQTVTLDNNRAALSGSRQFNIIPAGRIAPISPARLRDRLRRHSLPNTGVREVDDYRLRNKSNILRGLSSIFVAKQVGAPTFFGVVHHKVFRDAEFDDLGRIIGAREILELGIVSCRVVTDTGVAFIVDAFQNLVELENMKYHGFGTGGAAEAAANTALTTELTTQYAVNSTRPTGTTTEGATGNIFRTVATLTPDAAVAITEHGVFDQAATGGGTMIDRSLFSAVNLNGTGDALQTTYDLTFTSGS